MPYTCHWLKFWGALHCSVPRTVENVSTVSIRQLVDIRHWREWVQMSAVA